MIRTIEPAPPLRGTVIPPPDKSIAQRAALFAMLAEGTSVIENYPEAEDPLTALHCVRQLGVPVRHAGTTVVIEGVGRDGLSRDPGPIDCGNSGTVMRLLAGLLAGAQVRTSLSGDASLMVRPMKRIIDPLNRMGSGIRGSATGTPPLCLIPEGPLKAIVFDLPVPSAQLKSCVLLAGLFTEKPTIVRESLPSRNHTETMLGLTVRWQDEQTGQDKQNEQFWQGGKEDQAGQDEQEDQDVQTDQAGQIGQDAADYDAASAAHSGRMPGSSEGESPAGRLRGRARSRIPSGKTPKGKMPVRNIFSSTEVSVPVQNLSIPGDFSAATFWMVAATIVEGSDLLLPATGINPTRCAAMHILKRMGADITVSGEKTAGGEPVADIRVRSSVLRPVKLKPEEIPVAIDELPVLSVAMAFADGISTITGARELRYKECDRLAAMEAVLKGGGVEVEGLPDGMVIHGNPSRRIHAACHDSRDDHRIAMSAAILSLRGESASIIEKANAASVSYPAFWKDLDSLTK